jgi:hypothetical protein
MEDTDWILDLPVAKFHYINLVTCTAHYLGRLCLSFPSEFGFGKDTRKS